jgi:transcriptional/translational regulatory protein YebC/TACO1
MELLKLRAFQILKKEFIKMKIQSIKYWRSQPQKNDFASVLKQIEKLQYKIVDYELVKIAKDQVVLNDSDLEKIESLVSNLEDHDDVDSVWSNVKGI